VFDVNLKETKNGDDMYVLVTQGGRRLSTSGQTVILQGFSVMPSTMWKIKETA